MKIDQVKGKVFSKIDELLPEIFDINCWLYENPELPKKEYRSMEKLLNYLREYNFEIKQGIAGLDTSFIATKGKGGPRVGFLAEYDALPTVGHGCGHNIIGSSCVGTAVALSEVLENPMEIIVFGTPDEEFDGGKILMAEEGVFKGLDAVLQIHPSPYRNDVGGSSTPHQTMVINFHGKAAHTAFNPTEGINALNAVLITFIGFNSLQQYLKPGTRIPATITNGGGAPNIVPDFSQIRIHVTATDPEYLLEVVEKVENCAKAGALATGADLDIWKGPIYKKLYSNETLSTVLKRNLEQLHHQVVDPGEATSATDVGNVSWESPTTMGHLSLGIPQVPLHTSSFADSTIQENGKRVLVDAMKAMAGTMVEVIMDPVILSEVKRDFEELSKKLKK